MVVIDHDLCIGCRYCEAACPYGAPRFNEATGKAEKCHFCLHRTRSVTAASQKTENRLPACVAACVGEALFVIEESATSFTTGGEPAGFASRSMTTPSAEFVR